MTLNPWYKSFIFWGAAVLAVPVLVIFFTEYLVRGETPIEAAQDIIDILKLSGPAGIALIAWGFRRLGAKLLDAMSGGEVKK